MPLFFNFFLIYKICYNNFMYNIYKHKDLSWYEFKNAKRENLEEIAKKLSIDSYIIEKFLKKTTSDKTIRIGDTILISLSFPDYNQKEKKYDSTPVKFILGRNFMISGIYSKNEGLENYLKIFKINPTKGNFKKTDCVANAFSYAIDEIYKNLSHELNYIRKSIDSVEDDIFNNNEKKMVKKISLNNRKLIDFRKILKDHKKIWNLFYDLSKNYFIKRSTLERIDGISVSAERVFAESEELKEMLHELRDTNNSLLNLKQNETMKLFTLIAFLTLPVTLFLSIISLPTKQRFIIGQENDLSIILSILFVLFVIMFFYSIIKKWWN